MIEELTKENLEKYPLNEDEIRRLMEWETNTITKIDNDGYFVACNIEEKIYTGKEDYEKWLEARRNGVPGTPFYYNIRPDNIVNYTHTRDGIKKYTKILMTFNNLKFEIEIQGLPPEEIAERLNFHLRFYLRNNGNKADWINHTKKITTYNLSPEQKDVLLTWFESNEYVGKDITNVKKQKKINSYTWIGKRQNMNQLYINMKKSYIDKETSYKDFDNIFNNIDIVNINKVKWQKMPTDLLYFIYTMMQKGVLTNTKRMDYRCLKACFCKADGSTFDENFKEILLQIKKDCVVKNDIDELIKAIK